jgi:transposase
MTKQRRSFSQEFKLDSAKLVLDEGYSFPEAARSLEVGETALVAGLSNYKMSVVAQHQTLKRLPLSNKKFRSLKLKLIGLKEKKQF